VLQRIVDHEAQAGNTGRSDESGSRRAWTTTSRRRTPPPAAKDLHAKVQKDRADREGRQEGGSSGEDQNSATTRRGARGPGEGEQETCPRETVPRARHRQRRSNRYSTRWANRTKLRIKRGLGKLWYYRNAAVDPVTNKKTRARADRVRGRGRSPPSTSTESPPGPARGGRSLQPRPRSRSGRERPDGPRIEPREPVGVSLRLTRLRGLELPHFGSFRPTFGSFPEQVRAELPDPNPLLLW